MNENHIETRFAMLNEQVGLLSEEYRRMKAILDTLSRSSRPQKEIIWELDLSDNPSGTYESDVFCFQDQLWRMIFTTNDRNGFGFFVRSVRPSLSPTSIVVLFKLHHSVLPCYLKYREEPFRFGPGELITRGLHNFIDKQTLMKYICKISRTGDVQKSNGVTDSLRQFKFVIRLGLQLSIYDRSNGNDVSALCRTQILPGKLAGLGNYESGGCSDNRNNSASVAHQFMIPLTPPTGDLPLSPLTSPDCISCSHYPSNHPSSTASVLLNPSVGRFSPIPQFPPQQQTLQQHHDLTHSNQQRKVVLFEKNNYKSKARKRSKSAEKSKSEYSVGTETPVLTKTTHRRSTKSNRK